MLPEGWEQGEGAYTVAEPTTNLVYPGNDQEAQNPPVVQNFGIIAGPYTIDTGLYFELGSPNLFPEFKATLGPPTNFPSDDYAAGHNLNCTNEAASYGFSTFYFPDAIVAQFSGGLKKGYTQDEMDEKSLNCTPFGLFAAFCAWDGGQLMTDEVFDFIAGGAWPPNPALVLNPGATPSQYPPPPPRLAGANTICGPDGTSLNVGADSTQTCDGVYSFPDPARGGDFDASWRVAPPGRIPADAVAINTGDEPWHDLKGNLNEGVFRSDGRFTFRGYGIGWSSISAHRTQETTPRMKEGSFGARCMRFRDTPAPKTK
jgi:hypothetical protein